MKIKEYIKKILLNGNQEDIEELSDMLDEFICELKDEKPKLYKKYKTDLYEMANGKILTEEMALKMAYMWLNDEDSVKDKLYEYYKYIPKED